MTITVRIFTVVSVLLTCMGCDVTSSPQYAKLGLVEVSGKVMLEGTPLTNATIEFVNEEDQTYSYGYLDTDGSYSLMFDSRMPGIIPGEKSIRIREGMPAGASEMSSQTDGEDPDTVASARADIPACYKQTGKIKATITKATSSMNFNLKLDCSTTTNSN